MNDQNQPSASPFHSIRAVDYTVIFVRDMAAMRRFYEGVLRFPLTRELSAGWIEYQIGGNTLALVAAGPDGEGCADARRQRFAAARVQGCG